MPAEPETTAENSEEVRRQLKKTNLEEQEGMSITQVEEQPSRGQGASTAVNGEAAASDNEGRGRLRRKRSHEEVDVEAAGGGDVANNGKHARKRSKSGQPTEVMADKPPSSQDTVEDPAVPVLAASQADIGASSAGDGSLQPRSETPVQGEPQEKDAMLLSPKNKRTRDQYQQPGTANEVDAEAGDNSNTVSVEGSSKPAKRARDSNSPQPGESETIADAGEAKASAIPPTSGFANTSATSPFATVASPKSPQTSASAFASSGFSTFASASASPFAAAGSAAGSASPFGGFGAAATTTAPAAVESTTKPTTSVFGGPLNAKSGNASPFATTSTLKAGTAASSAFGGLSGSTSGFGGLSGGSAFGSGFAAVKPGAGLSSFATPGAVGITGLSNKPAKPFGAAADDDDDGAESDNEGDDDDNERDPDAEDLEAGIKSPPTTLSADKKDKRFKEQNIATGEEDETTVFVARGKLFINEDKQWKERGTGAFKLNRSTGDGGANDEEQGASKTRARLLLRAEGTQRVVLNSPIQKDLTYGNVKGGKPSSTEHFQFPSFYEGRLQILLVKMKQQNKEELWEQIEAIKKEI